MTALDDQFALAASRKAKSIPLQFETSRLLLRAGVAADLDETFRVGQVSADALREWMPWAHPAPLRESMEKYFSSIEEKWDAREQLDFQWIEKSTGALVGKGGFHHIDWTIPKFEIGYWLSTEHVGKGYCTEAVMGLVEFARTILGAKRLEIRSQPLNVRSRAVAERCGFTLEGINRSALVGADGSLRDACMYALIFDDSKSG
jgi:RimJ/RimL family protein N-acetyltransferase